MRFFYVVLDGNFVTHVQFSGKVQKDKIHLTEMIGDRWCCGTDDERLAACASRTQEARATFNTRATAVVLCRAVPALLLSRTRSLIVHITVAILSASITDV